MVAKKAGGKASRSASALRSRASTALGQEDEPEIFSILSIWTAQKNARVEVDLTQKGIQKASGLFRSDFLKLCNAVEVVPHPNICPKAPKDITADGLKEEPSEGSLASSKGGKKKGGASRSSLAGSKAKFNAHEELFDLSPIEVLSFRNIIVDTPNLKIALHLASQQDVCSVQKLEFYNVGLTHSQVFMLAEALRLTRIAELTLDYNPVPADATVEGGEGDMGWAAGARVFSALLGEESPLRACSLRGNRIGDDAGISIAGAISRNTRCATLNLFNNYLTDEAGIKIMDALKLNTIMSSISLANNRLGAGTAAALGALLTRYPLDGPLQAARAEAEQRRQVYNKHAAEAAKKGKPDAEPLPELPEVYPAEAGAEGGGGGAASASYVRGSATLRLANLGANAGVDGAAAQALFRSLIPYKTQLVTTLRGISLSGNPISEDIAEAFDEFSPIEFYF